MALIESNDPDPDANLVLNDHNVSCARSGEFCLLVDIDARTSSIIIPGGTTVLGSTSLVAACGYPVVELASGTYPGGVTPAHILRIRSRPDTLSSRRPTCASG